MDSCYDIYCELCGQHEDYCRCFEEEDEDDKTPEYAAKLFVDEMNS